MIRGFAAALGPALVFTIGAVPMEASGHPGRGLIVGHERAVYVPDAVRSIVWRMREGVPVSILASDVHAHWLALVDGTETSVDRIFAEIVRYDAASEKFFQRIVRLSGDGRAIGMLPENKEGRQIANCFLVSRDGLFYCAPDSDPPSICRRSVARDPASPLCETPLVISGDDGAPRFGSITSMAWAADGAISFSDGAGIHIVAPSGRVKTIVSAVGADAEPPQHPGPMKAGELWGLAWFAGTMFTTEPHARRILKVSDDGRITTLLRSEAPWFPTGVAVREGDIYVLEHGLEDERNIGPRVRILTVDGEVREVGIVSEQDVPD